MKMLKLLQAFNAMRCFLNKQFARYQLEDLGDFCSYCRLCYCENSNDWVTNTETWDAAMWHDWEDAVKEILPDSENINLETELSSEQTYNAMSNMLENFGKRTSSQEIAEFMKALKRDNKHSLMQQNLSDTWKQCVDDAISNNVRWDGGGIWIERGLTMQESLQSMIVFLQKWYMKKYPEITELVKSLEDLLQDVEQKNKLADRSFYRLWKVFYNKVKILNQESELHLIYESEYSAIGTFVVMYELVQYYQNLNFRWAQEVLKDIVINSEYEIMNKNIAHRWYRCVDFVLNKDIDYYMKQEVG